MDPIALPTLWINESVKMPILMLDNSGMPVTGILYTQIGVSYTRNADSSMVTFTPGSTDWSERGAGFYALQLPGTVVNQEGLFALVVTPPSSGTQETFRAMGRIATREEIRLLQSPVSGYGSGLAGEALLDASKPRYQVFGNPQYDYTNHILDFTVWMHQNGELVTTPSACHVTIKESNGGALVADLVSSSPNGDGVFYLQATSITLNPNKNYQIKTTVTLDGVDHVSLDGAESLN